MKTLVAVITVILVGGSITPFVFAESVPAWVKNNAGWWADGTISESEFVSAIQHLIKEQILIVPPTSASAENSQQGVPAWVKNNAGWWADGTITDGEFLNGIQHLIKLGIINVPDNQNTAPLDNSSVDSKLKALEAELDKCAEIAKAYKRLDCEKTAKHAITVYEYKNNSQVFKVGPITYYWPGFETEGNSFEISESGQPILSLRILAENTTPSENVSLNCTGPAICSYDVWDGSKAFKYSGMDFTNGQIVLKPGESRLFNMLFGPNIGYGGTTFEYDSSKSYVFRINEPFGSASIPLGLG